MGATQIILILLLLVLAGISISGYTSLEFSDDLRRFRKYYAVLRIKIGVWQPIPIVVGVTIKYFSTATKSDSKYSWGPSTNRVEEVIVMLSVRDASTGFIIGRFSVSDVNDAIDLAHDTAEQFQVSVNTYLPPYVFKPL